MAYSRPLSPHLQIYKPQITSVLSILHRGTGVVLAAGTIALVYWLSALALGENSYAYAHYHFSSWYGQIALLGWSISFYYHLFNGIRHLFWDAGYGFELPTLYLSGWVVVAATLALTTFSWTIVLTSGG